MLKKSQQKGINSVTLFKKRKDKKGRAVGKK